MIEADAPVFQYMRTNDPIRILGNASNSVTITEKYDDYTVKVSANVNLGTGQNAFVALNFLSIAPNVVFNRFNYLRLKRAGLPDLAIVT